MERLDKIISTTGKKSRREVKLLVKQGRILVDGVPAAAPEMKVDPAVSEILLDGEDIGYRRFTYIMLHKPAGVLSAVEDKRQQTVLDLLPEELQKRGLSPVGRLDKDTEGLLLLTNDGELTHKLLSPRHHVDKVYYARVEGTLEQADCDAFAAGMTLGDGLECMPAGLEILSPGEALVTLQEGKFHQVKRMLAARGKPVTYLKRLSMGPLQLDEILQPGQFRHLTEEELQSLPR
ncbi:MAG: 16S rRNA pseudouridine(516) synthase [Ruminococcaceae bacterium]|nr:16S rRNA pseudouridine(516) synthase [Oscillospiraceae bacterium]